MLVTSAVLRLRPSLRVFAWMSSCQGSVKKMKVALVQGKMIRYVHIPDEVDAIRNLQDHVSITVSHRVCSVCFLRPWFGWLHWLRGGSSCFE